MDYCIVNKLEFLNNKLVYTPIGYLTNMTDCDIINNNFEATFVSWVKTNKSYLEAGIMSISSFFETTPVVYSANHMTTSVEDMGLVEINNINEL